MHSEMKVNVTPGGKRYRFLPHALDRMSQRKVKKKDVESILDNYQVCYLDKKDNPSYIGLSGDGRKIRIVIVKASDPMEILTVIVQD